MTNKERLQKMDIEDLIKIQEMDDKNGIIRVQDEDGANHLFNLVDVSEILLNKIDEEEKAGNELSEEIKAAGQRAKENLPGTDFKQEQIKKIDSAIDIPEKNNFKETIKDLREQIKEQKHQMRAEQFTGVKNAFFTVGRKTVEVFNKIAELGKEATLTLAAATTVAARDEIGKKFNLAFNGLMNDIAKTRAQVLQQNLVNSQNLVKNITQAYENEKKALEQAMLKKAQEKIAFRQKHHILNGIRMGGIRFASLVTGDYKKADIANDINPQNVAKYLMTKHSYKKALGEIEEKYNKQSILPWAKGELEKAKHELEKAQAKVERNIESPQKYQDAQKKVEEVTKETFKKRVEKQKDAWER